MCLREAGISVNHALGTEMGFGSGLVPHRRICENLSFSPVAKAAPDEVDALSRGAGKIDFMLLLLVKDSY